MPLILYTTSSNPKPQVLEGNFVTAGDVKNHLIEKLGVSNAVLTLGAKFRVPLDDSYELSKTANKPFNLPTLLHVELI